MLAKMQISCHNRQRKKICFCRGFFPANCSACGQSSPISVGNFDNLKVEFLSRGKQPTLKTQTSKVDSPNLSTSFFFATESTSENEPQFLIFAVITPCPPNPPSPQGLQFTKIYPDERFLCSEQIFDNPQ